MKNGNDYVEANEILTNKDLSKMNKTVSSAGK